MRDELHFSFRRMPLISHIETLLIIAVDILHYIIFADIFAASFRSAITLSFRSAIAAASQSITSFHFLIAILRRYYELDTIF
jgi:hypothetical protein